MSKPDQQSNKIYPPPRNKHCHICGERYDPDVDEYHLENCRDRNKP